MKVLHAPISALYQPALIVRGLRELGVQADLMYHEDIWKGYTFQSGDELITGSSIISSVNLDFFLNAIEKYDVIHLHSGYSLAFQSRKNKELRLLQKMGKVVVIHRWGCADSRIPTEFRNTRGMCAVCTIDRNNCNDALNDSRMTREYLYADRIIDPEIGLESPDPMFEYLPPCIDTQYWRPDLSIPPEQMLPPKEGVVRILHAVGGSGRGDIKGTSVVRAAIEDLKEEGYPIEYSFIQGVSFKDLRYHLLQTDIVVDQLRYGSFGSFAREAMAMGKPVLGHVVTTHRDKLPDLPIIEAPVKSFAKTLRSVLESPESWEDIGRRGRAFVEKEYDYRAVSRRLINLYDELLRETHNRDGVAACT